ncbi:MAG: hypothetical protein ABFS17_09640 [Chloroflexota bacterium]
MSVRKIESIDVVGFVVSPDDEKLEDQSGSLVVFTEETRRGLLTAKKRDTNLLAFD